MRRKELEDELLLLVGDMRKVERIFTLFSKLSPEPNSGNIKNVVVNYNKHLIKKAPKKVVGTIEQRAKAKEILRRMGMI